MKKATDFRKIARTSLKGKWFIAIIACIIAALLGGVAPDVPTGGSFNTAEDQSVNLKIGDVEIFSPESGFNPELFNILMASLAIILVIGIIVALFYLFLGSVIEVGYRKFNLDLVDRKEKVEIGSMFSYFHNWKTLVAANLLQTIFVFLWSLLLVIPGILAAYSYSMTSFILAEHPEMKARDAIRESKRMMRGNRWRLFCLEFSFIGWNILAALTCGIGSLWVNPYRYAAVAAFYRECSGTEVVVEAALPQPEAAE